MRVLFIGGTGIISSACARRCIELGHEMHLLNRGKSIRSVPTQANVLIADYRDTAQVQNVLSGSTFDVVVDFICFKEKQAIRDVELFQDKTGQFIFISSASAYQTPPASLPVTEETPLENPFWQYSRDKIACEHYFMNAYREHGFPVTIARPSHTYDRLSVPFPGGNLLFHRAQAGKKVIVHGDGTSLWTLTHNTDFAKGFCGLLGNRSAIGEAYHITSDEYLSWNQIAALLLFSADLDTEIVHIPSDFIARFDGEYVAGLLGDKSHSMIFDNSKIKQIVPEFRTTVSFAEGVKQIGEWYKQHGDSLAVNVELDEKMDRIISRYEALF